jgi:hypothetical protein
MENTATPRQRWALYCITKKDYRNEILSKEEAAKLIQELGNPDYKKASKVAKSLSSELLDYLKEHFDEMFGEAVKSLSLKSVIVEDTPKDSKQYAFIGFGCGITYFDYRKNNKKAEEINKAANQFHYNEIEKMFLSKFTTKERNYYKKIGCPLEAIWAQDQNMQLSYYYKVQDIAKSKGIEMKVVSRLD